MRIVFLFFVITSCYCWHSNQLLHLYKLDIGHAVILQIALNQVNYARKVNIPSNVNMQNRVKTLLEGLEENHLVRIL